MSATITKQELTRLAWLTELRQQGHRQCVHTYTDGWQGVCALGLLREVGLPIDEREYMDSTADVGALAGLDDDQALEVACRNDGDGPYHKHTFAEIADVVASWFPAKDAGL